MGKSKQKYRTVVFVYLRFNKVLVRLLCIYNKCMFICISVCMILFFTDKIIMYTKIYSTKHTFTFSRAFLNVACCVCFLYNVHCLLSLSFFYFFLNEYEWSLSILLSYIYIYFFNKNDQ